MDLDWYILYPLVIAAGILSGGINTLAGNGSAVTLTMFLLLGLPADVANGSNRIGTILQTGVALLIFNKSGKIAPLRSKVGFFVLPTFIGAMAGAYTASQTDAQVLEEIIGIFMIIMLFVILIKPKRWLRETDLKANNKTPLNILIFLAIGFYAGFIQMGMGLLFLAALVLGGKFNLIDANIMKLLIIICFAVPVLFIYWNEGQVNWEMGLLLAGGQAIGGGLAAKFAVGNEKAAVWVYRLLIVMVLVGIAKVFGLYELIF